MPTEQPYLAALLPWRHNRRSACVVKIVRYEVCGECGQDKPVQVGRVLLGTRDWWEARDIGADEVAAVIRGCQDPVGEAAQDIALNKWERGLGREVA